MYVSFFYLFFFSGEIPHENSLGNLERLWDPSRLEFTITELAKGPFTRRKLR